MADTRTEAARPTTNPFALAAWGLLFSVYSGVGVALFSATITFIGLIPVWVGIPASLMLFSATRGYADQHRLWAGKHLGIAIARPYKPAPEGWWLARIRGHLTDRQTWRDLAWLLVQATAGMFLNLLPISLLLSAGWYLILPFLFSVTPPGVFDTNYGLFRVDSVGTAFITYAFAVVAFVLFRLLTVPIMLANGRLNRWLLGPVQSEALARRVVQLTESRADTVDTQAAELRRIERDLHDGAQARLVSLGMSLGMAEEMLASNPQAAQNLLAEARESTGLALSELRDLVRGIHPPVLADRGLDGAVRALAMASPLPVEVTVELPGRPPAPVESAMYFAVAETLTNVAKHSGATSAWIRVSYTDGTLGAMVGDDGRGGASATSGGGLHGIERRLSAFDGIVHIASPLGGPTIVTMELPCVLSSVKTSPSSETA
ncbi:MAG TPA: sensor domain-containing protein [Pseudonocardiaceae bacterium]|nr:sensor domain-containing protein [Pseudonocardiaceae bacterium]